MLEKHVCEPRGLGLPVAALMRGVATPTPVISMDPITGNEI